MDENKSINHLNFYLHFKINSATFMVENFTTEPWNGTHFTILFKKSAFNGH